MKRGRPPGYQFKKTKWFSEWLAKVRYDQNITLRQAQERTGVDYKTLFHYENGDNEPTLFQAERIINGLGFDLVVISRHERIRG